MKKIFMSLAALAVMAVMASCSGNANSNGDDKKCENDCKQEKCEGKADCKDTNCDPKCNEKAASEKTGDASAAIDLSKKYICPNRCESSDNPGNCSVCEMELVEQ